MQLSLSLEGLPVVVLGEADAARQALARYRRAGARITFFASPDEYMEAAFSGAAAPITQPTVAGPAVARPEVARPAMARSAVARPALVAVVGGAHVGRTHDGGAHDDGRSPSVDWSPVLEHYRALGVPLVEEPPAGRRGHVTLVGGGPGSRGLLTVDALEALRDADVVLFDRLAPWRELEGLTTARLVDVGKLPGHHKVPQEEINRLIVEYARYGINGRPANVVRLKGGDPFVFGRGSEEAQACADAGIPVAVVSGISSALAVPASAGIPVTERNVSHSFTVISGHAPLSPDEHRHLAGLAAGGGTVVVLMGIANLPHLAAGLRAAGLCPTTPLAVVERGHQPGQRTTVTELATAEAATAQCANPAVIVIGDVVRRAGDGRLAASLIMEAQGSPA